MDPVGTGEALADAYGITDLSLTSEEALAEQFGEVMGLIIFPDMIMDFISENDE